MSRSNSAKAVAWVALLVLLGFTFLVYLTPQATAPTSEPDAVSSETNP